VFCVVPGKVFIYFMWKSGDEIGLFLSCLCGKLKVKGAYLVKKLNISFLAILFLLTVMHGQALAKDWIIKPGVGIGWIKIGMKYSYVKRSLGKADSVTHVKNGLYYSYKRKYGLALLVNYGGELLEIEIYKDRCGKTGFVTSSGVTVGQDVRTAFKYYGKPVFSEPDQGGRKYIWRHGISILSDPDSKIKMVIISKPIDNP